jgi:hypothetical protein
MRCLTNGVRDAFGDGTNLVDECGGVEPSGALRCRLILLRRLLVLRLRCLLLRLWCLLWCLLLRLWCLLWCLLRCLLRFLWRCHASSLLVRVVTDVKVPHGCDGWYP